MEFLFPVPPYIIRNEMFTTFYPFLYVFTEAGPKKAKSNSIKDFILAHVASIWSCMEVAEYFLSQSCRNYDQREKSIFFKESFV